MYIGLWAKLRDIAHRWSDRVVKGQWLKVAIANGQTSEKNQSKFWHVVAAVTSPPRSVSSVYNFSVPLAAVEYRYGCLTWRWGPATLDRSVASYLLRWFEAGWNPVLSSNRLWLAVIKCHSLRNKSKVCGVDLHDCHMITEKESRLIGYLRSSCPPLCSYSRPSQRS